jgi:hydrogenase nickel incorporation protein HypB
LKSAEDRQRKIEAVSAEEGEVYDIELNVDILQKNRELADKNSELFRARHVKVIDILGSLGSGKTSIIEQLIPKLWKKYKIAVFNGDLTITKDLDRFEKLGVQVVQINTGKECHLDANLVNKAISKVDLSELELIFIENVGNLICPAEFPLGSDKQVVVVSVTEGPYMITKHPFIFMDADVVIINKIDLADIMGIDVDQLEKDANLANPSAKVVRTNCRKAVGIDALIKALDL